MSLPTSTDASAGRLVPPEAMMALLREREHFLLLAHRNPDGDAVGSALALAAILEQAGKTAEIVFPSPPPDWWVLLPGSRFVVDAPTAGADVAIALDCADLSRLGDAIGTVRAAATCVEIDHHADVQRSCPVRYIDPSACAVGAMIYRIMPGLGAQLTADIATCIYWAVATDTGFFRFGNTDAEALGVCAECVRAGAQPDEIARQSAGTKPIEHLRLKGRALAGMRVHLGGRVLTSAIGPTDFATAGAGRQHCEDIIDDMRTAAGAALVALLKAPENETDWEISLRSRSVNCAALASTFGGGGHAEAAGYSFDGPAGDALDALITRAGALLDDNASA